MADKSDLFQLLNAFQKIGAKIPVWTQAQGSNLSLKNFNLGLMYIKPSGFRLDQVHSEKDLVVLKIDQLKDDVLPLLNLQRDDSSEQVYAKVINDSKVHKESPLRPSMETGFHLVLQRKYVFHFHALAAVAMGFFYETQQDKILNFLKIATPLSVAFVDYGTPGLDLTVLLQRNKTAHILILRNHGVILNSDTADILADWEKIERRFCEEFVFDQDLTDFTTKKAHMQNLSPIPLEILFPDFAVFLRRMMPCLISSINQGQELWTFNPSMIEKEKDLFEIWLSYWLLYKACPQMKPLSETEVQKICGLPTEQYRLMIKQQRNG